MVTPVTGLNGVHEVGAAGLEAAVNGRRRRRPGRVVERRGAVHRARGDHRRPGRQHVPAHRHARAARPAPDQMCIEIAVYKGAVVDLGELEPGTYTITAFGDAAPVEVTVAG